MKVNRVFRDVGMSKIVEVSEKARLLAPDFEKRTETPFIYFQRGEVGVPVAPFVADGYAEAIKKGFTKYPKSGGENFYKDAVIKYLGSKNIVGMGRDNILAAHGGQEGLQLVFQLFAGKTCAVLTPCWSCMFDNILPYTNTNVVNVPLNEKDWSIDFDGLELAFRENDVELFYFNNPHNPTGRVFSKEDTWHVLELCRKYGVLLISDEAYNELAYTGEHYSPLRFTPHSDNVVGIFTFSKSLAATGFRVGFVASRRTDIIENLVKGNYTQTAGLATPTQYAFAKALEHPDFPSWLDNYKNEMALRAKTLADNLDPLLEAKVPEGAFYCFLDLNYRNSQSDKTSEVIDMLMNSIKNPLQLVSEATKVEHLLQNGIAVVPGSAFGVEFEGYIRLSFSTLSVDLIKEGAQRLNEIVLGRKVEKPEVATL